MEMMILGVLVLAGIGLVIYALTAGRGEAKDTIQRRMLGQGGEGQSDEIIRKARNVGRQSFIERAAPLLSRPVMPKTEGEQTSLRLRLASAGLRAESAATVFLASKSVCAAALGLLGLWYSLQFGKPAMSIFGFTVFGAALGFLGPELWLYTTRKQRMEAIRNGLPDALDLMVVSVEAGLGLDAAILRVGDEMKLVHADLSEELQIATVETQLGVQRGEALQKMANRTGVEEMKSLVAVIVQAEKLGTSIAKALRSQAEALRTKRRQKAEERAQKTAVKLMLPLILFIFPAILIVLGVPAGIKLAQTLSGNGPLAGS